MIIFSKYLLYNFRLVRGLGFGPGSFSHNNVPEAIHEDFLISNIGLIEVIITFNYFKLLTISRMMKNENKKHYLGNRN